jgi:hypothetical protein
LVPIAVDYNKSVDDVYIDNVLHTAVSGLRVLSQVSHPVQFHKENRPSWLPNWNPAAREYTGPEELKFSKCVRRREVSSIDPRLAHNGLLRLKGLLCDSIVDCTEVFSTKNDLDDAWRSQLHGFFRNVWNKNVEVDGMSSEAFLKKWLYTLMGGRSIFTSIIIDDPESVISTENRKAFLRTMQPDEYGTPNKEDHGNAILYENSLRRRIDSRRELCTSNAWFGLGPQCMRSGDIIAAFDGADSPYVLRLVQGRPDHYYLMGECYVEDLADEKAYDMIGKDRIDHFYMTGECHVDRLAEERAYGISEKEFVEETVFNLI